MLEVDENRQMSNVDISNVLRGMLIKIGVPSHKIDAFNQHSTIELTLKDTGPLWIHVEHHRIWVWAGLKMLNATNIGFYSQVLIDALLRPLPGVLTGHVALAKRDEAYEIKALLDPECTACLDNMAQMFEAFYELLKFLNAAFKNERLSSNMGRV